MGLQNGSYVSVWKVEDKGNYSVAQITSSKKNKSGDGYETDFQSNFVNLVGSAHEMAKTLMMEDHKPARIQVKDFMVKGGKKVERNGRVEYPYYFTIFEFEHAGQSNGGKNSYANQNGTKKSEKSSYNNYPDDDGELPFLRGDKHGTES